MKTVPDILRESADLFEERNKDYGSAYKDHPHLLFALIGPIQLETPDDYERLIRISTILGKLNRYSKNFSKGGHTDSANDLTVFAAMLAEFQQFEE